MSYPAKRETRRMKDQAYYLLGVFDFSMSLIYGEGTQEAFLKLEIEIIAQTRDESFSLGISLTGTNTHRFLRSGPTSIFHYSPPTD